MDQLPGLFELRQRLVDVLISHCADRPDLRSRKWRVRESRSDPFQVRYCHMGLIGGRHVVVADSKRDGLLSRGDKFKVKWGNRPCGTMFDRERQPIGVAVSPQVQVTVAPSVKFARPAQRLPTTNFGASLFRVVDNCVFRPSRSLVPGEADH